MNITVWRNIASNPSRVVERGEDGIVKVLTMLDVPKCSVAPAVKKIMNGEGASLMMTSRGGSLGMKHFNSVMKMSYTKDNKDYFEYNIVDASNVAVGQYFEVECNGTSTHFVLWPKCQNIAILTKSDTHKFNNPPTFDHPGPSSISEPASLVLFMIGALAIGVVRKWK